MSILDKPPLLSDLEVLEIARKYLSYGQIVYKYHFKGRMDQRNISLQNVIENGRIAKTEWNNDHDQYHYSIAGEDIEGIPLTVVIALSSKDEMLILITLF